MVAAGVVAACYVVAIYGFDAVVKNVMAQLRLPDAGHSTKARPPGLIAPLT
jgi:hypothetical protein